MEDEEKQAVQDVSTSQDTDTSPVSQEESPDTQAQDEPQTSEKKEEVTNQAEDAEPKQTRGERRIHKLIDKLKAKDESPDNSQLFGNPNEPLIDPNQQEVDPNQFNQRYTQNRYQDRELVKRELKAEINYERTVEDHLADAENISKEINDDKIEGFLAKRYEEINNVYNPQTGEYVFVPRVKMSELYKDIKDILSKSNAAAQADVTGKIRQQAEESATPTSGKSQSPRDYNSEALYENARESGKTEDWAEVIKRRIY